MPAVSQNQAVAMNMAEAIQEGKIKPKPGTASAEIAKSAKPSDVKEFAGPINKTLPKKVTKPKVATKTVQHAVKTVPFK